MACHNKFVLEPGFCISAVLVLYLLPLNWALAWFAASIIHELCHYFTMLILGINVHSIRITAAGAIMQTDAMTWICEIIAALAGPAGAMCLLFVTRFYPEAALCALLQSAYNLLPVYPLDGGRALRCFALHYLGTQRGMGLCDFVKYATLLLLLLFASVLTFCYSFGILPLFIVIMIFVRAMNLKIPCKATKQIVQ